MVFMRHSNFGRYHNCADNAPQAILAIQTKFAEIGTSSTQRAHLSELSIYFSPLRYLLFHFTLTVNQLTAFYWCNSQDLTLRQSRAQVINFLLTPKFKIYTYIYFDFIFYSNTLGTATSDTQDQRETFPNPPPNSSEMKFYTKNKKIYTFALE